jgi:hypothetical protein
VLSGVPSIVLSGAGLSCYQACGGGLTACSKSGIGVRKSSKYLESLKRSLQGRFESKSDRENAGQRNPEEFVQREPGSTPGDLVIDSSLTAWMTGRRTVGVHGADRLVAGSLAVVARDDTGSEERDGEVRGSSKIKGGGTAGAGSRGPHVNGGSTPRSWATGDTLPDYTRCLLPVRAVHAGLRRATRNHPHG